VAYSCYLTTLLELSRSFIDLESMKNQSYKSEGYAQKIQTLEDGLNSLVPIVSEVLAGILWLESGEGENYDEWAAAVVKGSSGTAEGFLELAEKIQQEEARKGSVSIEFVSGD
jgi:hypothetical protein